MLIPTTVPNLMKFGSFVLQGRWGIGKGELLLFFFSWQWHHLLILLLWWTLSSNKPSNITLYLQDCVTKWLQDTGAMLYNEGRNTDGIMIFFSFQQICARCVNIDNFSGAQLKTQYRFLFDEGKREWESIPAMVFTGNVLPLLPNLSKQNQKSQIQMSLWVILCSGPNFYLPTNWQTGKFICENMW